LPIIGAIFTDAWNTVWAIVQLYIGLVLVQVQFLLDTIRNTFAFWKAIFTGDWGGAWNALKDQAAAIWNLLSGLFGLALDAVRETFVSKIGMLIQIGKDIGNVILSAFDSFGVSRALSRPFDIARDAVDWLIRRVERLIDTINRIPTPKLPSLPGGGIPGVPGLQQGTSFVPKNMLAILHRGEMVIPERFATPLRHAALSPVSIGGGTNISVPITYAPQFSTASPAEAEIFADMVEQALRRRLRA